jgi:hypothetical protein
MKAINIPTKLPIAFASSGSRNAIPVPSQIAITPGAASLTDGFPPLTMLPVAAGGIPPLGADFNGILYESTSWNVWEAAGGAVPYDATFSTAIGGYPKGAMLANATTVGAFWISTVDDNTSNPDTGGGGWLGANLFGGIQNFRWGGTSGGSANAQTLTPSPAATSYAAGDSYTFLAGFTNTAATTMAISGLAAKNIYKVGPSGPAALIGGEIKVGGIYAIQYDGTQLQLLDEVLLGSDNTWGGKNTFTKQTVGQPVAYANAATVTLDFALGNNFIVSLQGGNVTLAAPLNAVAGQGGTVQFTQDTTTPRLVAFNSAWKFPGGIVPSVTAVANSYDLMSYYVSSSPVIFATMSKAFS